MLHYGAGRALAWGAAALAVATIVGLAVLWPSGRAGERRGPTQAFAGPSTQATVVASSLARCPGPVAQQCRRLAPLTLGPVGATSAIEPGAAIHARSNAAPAAGAGPGAEPYGRAQTTRTVTGIELIGVAEYWLLSSTLANQPVGVPDVGAGPASDGLTLGDV